MGVAQDVIDRIGDREMVAHDHDIGVLQVAVLADELDKLRRLVGGAFNNVFKRLDAAAAASRGAKTVWVVHV